MTRKRSAGTIAPMPTTEPMRLSDEFMGGPPTIAIEPGGRLSRIAVRYIYWAKAEGVTAIVIGKALGITHWAVARRIWRLRNSPTDELYNCGFVVAVHTGENDVWTKYLCRYCLATFKRMIDAGAHAFRHLYDDGDNIMPKQRHS